MKNLFKNICDFFKALRLKYEKFGFITHFKQVVLFVFTESPQSLTWGFFNNKPKTWV